MGMTDGMTKEQQAKIKEAIEMFGIDPFIVPSGFSGEEKQEKEGEKNHVLIL